MKFALYQQGARGYGRFARSIKLINVLNEIYVGCTGVLFSGTDLIFNFQLPNNIEVIKLLEIDKGLNQKYSQKYCGLDIDECLSIRSNRIKNAIYEFQPDVFFIDLIPTGVMNELKDVIIWMKDSNLSTKIILVTRDIIDSPNRTIIEWKKYDVYNFLDKYYDGIFVLGSKVVFDFCKEYKISGDLFLKVIHCNYFSQKYFLKSNNENKQEYEILVTLGGGIDGYRLVKLFLDLYKEEKWSFRALIILGQQFPIDFKKNIIARLPSSIEIIDFTESLVDFFIRSQQIICMGGYNTITELLALKKHPIVIPREAPTREQSIRSLRLNELSLISLIKEDKLALKNAIMFDSQNQSVNHSLIEFNLNEIITKNLNSILN